MSTKSQDVSNTAVARELLATYLRYALDELSAVNKTSAALVEMAILALEDEDTMMPHQAKVFPQ